MIGLYYMTPYSLTGNIPIIEIYRVVCGFGFVLPLISNRYLTSLEGQEILPRPVYAAVSKKARHRGGSISHAEIRDCHAAKIGRDSGASSEPANR